MIRLDCCGAPLVPLSPGCFVHLLPLTVYHVERWIWSTAPEIENVDSLLQVPRPSPDELTLQEFDRVIASGLCYGIGESICEWLGGRPLTEKEWFEASAGIWSDKHITRAAISESAASVRGDRRIARAMGAAESFGLSHRSEALGGRLVDLVTQKPGRLYGAIESIDANGDVAVIFGAPAGSVRRPEFTVSCVFQEARIRTADE